MGLLPAIEAKLLKKSGRKKSYKWQVKFRGVRISRHTTKTNALRKAKTIRGAKVVPYGKVKRNRYYKRSRR